MISTHSATPHNLEAEKTVLGAILLDPEAILKVRPILKCTDFYDPVYKSVYEACTKLFDDQIPIDFVTVARLLEDHQKIQAIGGSAFLADLATSVPTSSHVLQYAEIVLEKSQRRTMLKKAQEIAALAQEEDTPFAELLGTAQEKILQLHTGSRENYSQSLGEVTEVLYKEAMAIKDGGDGGEARRFYTGFQTLDYLFGGFRPSELSIIVGRPGMGKSALMLNMAMNGAEQFGKQVLFMSREMSNQENAKRIIANRLETAIVAMDRGELSDDQYTEFGRNVDRFQKIPFTFDDDPDSSITNIRTKAMRHKLEHGLDVLFVDYLQLLEPPTDTRLRYSNRVEQMSKISRDLKKLGRELNVPLIVGCQMNRAVEMRPDKRPQLSDIRESGSIEQDANNVIMMHRDSYYDLDPDSDASDVTQLFIRKHRQGAMGVVELQFKQNTTTYLQVDRRHEESRLSA